MNEAAAMSDPLGASAPRAEGLLAMLARTTTLAPAGIALCAALALAPASPRSEVREAPLAGRGGCRSSGRGAAPNRLAAARVARQIHSHISGNLPQLGAVTRRRLAQAIIGEAKAAGVDPLLVLALIHVESSFDPRAASRAGAVGLMQLKVATLRAEVARAGLPSPTDPFDPVVGVQAGVRYLRRLLDAFGGIDLALMAYNAGPSRIGGLLRDGEIPERFFLFPRRVKVELERLRGAPSEAAPAPVSLAEGQEAIGCLAAESGRMPRLEAELSRTRN